MAITAKAMAGLLLVFLSSCKHATTNDQRAADSKMMNADAVDWSQSELAKALVIGNNSAAKARDSAKKSPCFFDESEILSNKNLSSLLVNLENTDLTIYRKKDAIPKFILKFLDCSRRERFTLANPGEDWQATDVISIKDLPRRQLVFFGKSDNIALLVHYTGGIGKSEHILIFKIAKEQVVDFWCGTVLADLKDKQKTVDYLKK